MRDEYQRRPNRRDRKASQTKKAIGVLLTLFLVIGGVGYFYFTSQANIRPINTVNFCPTDAKGPNSITAILIDRTESFNLTQEAALRDRLNDLKQSTSRYDLIEVYTVEPTETKLLAPQFSMCNPGRGEDTNSWTGNPHLIEERWKTTFDAPLDHLFSSILGGDDAKISPIMESIQSIVVTRLGAHRSKAETKPRRLIVVSDLLEYVKGYSQYKPLQPFAEFRATPLYQNVRADLSGIDVEFWYVRRQKDLAHQGEKHVDFWRDYIADQGGTVDKVWYVPGT